MKGYKAPSFQDRAAASIQAKEKALAKLKAAPQPDAAELAARAARRVEREALAEAKANPPKRTEAEQKAARDARYAALKNRK